MATNTKMEVVTAHVVKPMHQKREMSNITIHRRNTLFDYKMQSSCNPTQLKDDWDNMKSVGATGVNKRKHESMTNMLAWADSNYDELVANDHGSVEN